MNNKKYLILIVSILLIICILFILLFYNNFMTGNVIKKDYLKTLKLQSNIECLQNSQCSEGYECISNNCIKSAEMNNCQNIQLSTSTNKLKSGMPINSYKKVITNSELPNLLTNGKIIEIIDDKLTEYFYTQVILIGNNKIEKENLNYLIKTNSNEPLYTLRIAFSKGIDFSDREIQGQVLRILGKEYTIGYDSTNSLIYLISEDKTIKLEEGRSIKIGLLSSEAKDSLVKINKDINSEVNSIDVSFDLSDVGDIKTGEDYVNSVFNNLDFSFYSVDANEFADVRIGGDC